MPVNPKPKPKWQHLQRLDKPTVAAHLAALKAMVEAFAAKGQTPTTRDMRPHLEPLLKHYHLSHRIGTLAEEINTATGLGLNQHSFGRLAKEWGIPPANAQGRGLSRPAGGKGIKFRNF